MTVFRPSNDHQRWQLKVNIRREVTLAGGVTSFEQITRVKAPALSKYCSPDDEMFMPMDVWLDLIIDTKSTATLEYVAAELGLDLVPRKVQPQGSELPNMRDMSRLGRDYHDVFEEVERAVADGNMTLPEAHKVSARIQQLIDDARELERKAMRAANGGDA